MDIQSNTYADNQVFECHNPACTLGSRKEPGRFTNGMTEAGLELIYGTTTEEQREEEGVGVGTGYCPNCGALGTPATDDEGEPLEHVSLVGDDPNQSLHDEVNAKVLNEEIAPEDAQAHLEQLVETETSN